MAVSGVKDLVPRVAQKLSISKVESKKIVETVLEAVEDMIVEQGGFNHKGQFTISISEKKARSGRIVRKDENGEKVSQEWSTPAHKALSIKTGTELKERINQ